MDEIFLLLLFVFVVLILPWILLARSRRLRSKLREEWEERFADQNRRIYSLETSFESLRREMHTAAQGTSPAERAVTEEKPAAARVQEQKPVAPEKSTYAPVPPPAPVSAAVVPPPPPVRRSIPTDFVPKFIEPLPPTPGLLEKLKGFDIEEALGTNWLLKIGIAFVVFGIAFFLALQMKTMGPAGKVLIGFLVSAALLGGGVFLERKPGYVLLGRAGLGGGWALAFFTTYAMYHVEAAKILSSESLDLVLMGVVASGMVAHSLRYRSQLVTGLAFLLAFSTCTISQVSVYSLGAGLLLTGALVVVVLRMRWWELEIFGLLAAYLNHFYWLHHIIEPMGGHKRPFPEFYTSAGILIAYWLIFRASYLVRSVDNSDTERIATASALLNSFGLLGLLKYQSVHPELAFYALLALGAMETALSLYARPRRRMAFAVLASIGITLLFAAIPFRFAMTNVSIVWIAGVEALLAVGIFTREIVFRRLSLIAAGAAVAQMLAVDTARVIGARMDDAMPGRIISLGVAILFAALVLYANSTYVRRRWSELLDVDSDALRLVSYGAAALTLSGLWVMFPKLETALAWALAALVAAYASLRAGDGNTATDLKIQADVMAVFALIRAVAFNFDASPTWTAHHISQRLVTVSLCALAFYVASRVKSSYSLGETFRVPDLYTWTASALMGSLLWYELHSVSVASAWALFGFILLETGLARASLSLRLQGYVALALSFVRIFTANLAASGRAGEISPRVYSSVPVVLILAYVYWRLTAGSAEHTSFDRRFHAPAGCSWMALVSFAALIRFELQPDWVAVAWAAFVPVLLAIAWRSGRDIFTGQALFMAFAMALRAGLHNLYQRSVIPGPILYSRIVCVGSACALLFGGLPIAYRLLRRYPSPREGAGKARRAAAALLRRPEQAMFFVPFVLVIALLWAEMSRGLLTMSWSIFGVIAFVFGLWLGERSFRLAGLGLLLLGVAKIIVIDVWSLGARDRYLTFITMGTALLLVSFFYTRFREMIRRYL